MTQMLLSLFFLLLWVVTNRLLYCTRYTIIDCPKQPLHIFPESDREKRNQPPADTLAHSSVVVYLSSHAYHGHPKAIIIPYRIRLVIENDRNHVSYLCVIFYMRYSEHFFILQVVLFRLKLCSIIYSHHHAQSKNIVHYYLAPFFSLKSDRGSAVGISSAAGCEARNNRTNDRAHRSESCQSSNLTGTAGRDSSRYRYHTGGHAIS